MISSNNTFCINLDSQPEKWVTTQQELAKHDGSISANRKSAIAARPPWRGCLQSHLDIIEEAKNRSLDMVLILEDDIQIYNSNWINVMNSSLKELNSEDWAVLKLGGTYDHHIQATRISKNLVRIDNGALWLCHSQIINSKYYDTFLNAGLSSPKNKTNIDEYICSDVFYKKMFVTDPLLIFQRAGYSTIDDRKVDRGLRSRRMYRKVRSRIK